MRVTRLHLRNYRVYEDPIDIELAPGLVGIYGLNGSGKSTLLESIRFALFGRARTSLDHVRTSDVNADCVAEVEFEHEGHLYVVRRTITGAGHHVKATAMADGLQVAEGARDTARYVHSVLGMDDTSFRASVFAEQKQLAILSHKRPEERRQLVLQLLGITPVDSARDHARKQARDAQVQVERLRALLPDLDALRAEAADCGAEAAAAAAELEGHEQRAAGLRVELEQADAEYDRLEARRQEHDLVAAEATAVESEVARALARIERLTGELGELEKAAGRLASVTVDAEGWQVAEARLRALQAVAAALEAVEAAPVPDQPEPPDERAAETDRIRAEEARSALAEVEGLLRAAVEERRRAAEALQRSSVLSDKGACPLCGQALGDAFEQVRAHRAGELAEVEGRAGALARDRARLAEQADAAARRAQASTTQLRRLQSLWTAYERARARRTEAERALERAMAAVAGPADPAELPALAAEVARRRRAADEAARLRGRLERRPRLESELEAERLAADTSRGRLSALVEKLVTVGFAPEALAAARERRNRVRQQAHDAERRWETARLTAVQKAAAAEAACRRVADAEGQHARLAEQVDEARHLQRLGELLHAFRNTLVATVGPRLSATAGALFADLTDSDYDDLAIDPDTYEIRVCDRGRLYGMDRFSGSETDLANLALRVAISEHVQFQSGGTVGLLVLDEVFGPLDDERKERMLMALERLRARFRQVLVVTHDPAVKEQLPHALEVVKLPGRRATLRMVT